MSPPYHLFLVFLLSPGVLVGHSCVLARYQSFLNQIFPEDRSWTRQKKRHYWDSGWNLNYVCGLDGRLEPTILSWLGGWHGGNMRKFSLFKEHNKDFLDLNSGWNLSCQYNIGHIKEPLLNLIFLIWRILIAELSWRLNQTVRVMPFACCTSYNQIYLAFLIISFSYP